ncbi:integrase_H2C2 domain-containing protein [Trichonephila clavipes]|nr:integrase_H2C2 domain-containing protein [Trichonephila clavipes]
MQVFRDEDGLLRIRTNLADSYEKEDFKFPILLPANDVVVKLIREEHAVHFELVQSLTTDIFIKALRRFIVRKGRISVLYSDNGTNFVGTNNALRTLDWDKIVVYSTAQKITWKFIPPTAA